MFFTSMTYGTAIPTGLFLPSIIIGFGVGALYTDLAVAHFSLPEANITVFPLLFGAAGMITSLTGLSYSVIILLLEMSDLSNLAIPMIACVLIARILTSVIVKSTYQCELR